MLQLRNRRQVLDNYFNGCRSSAGLSSDNLGNDVKIETTISASESGSSLKVSIFFSSGVCICSLFKEYKFLVYDPL